MARVIWSPRTIRELEAICEYVARDAEPYARLVAERIVKTVEGIYDFLEAGSVVPEFENPNIRERLAHRYRVIYRIAKSYVEVVTIFHASRELPDQADISS